MPINAKLEHMYEQHFISWNNVFAIDIQWNKLNAMTYNVLEIKISTKSIFIPGVSLIYFNTWLHHYDTPKNSWGNLKLKKLARSHFLLLYIKLSF